MPSLQELAYQQIPRSIIKTIVTQQETYPEYYEVISRLNNVILSRFRTKVTLTKSEIILISILLTVYYHIKNHPPEKYIEKIDKKTKKKNPVTRALNDFISNNYPLYDDFDIDSWPKLMFLLYHTYTLSYRAWYNYRPPSGLPPAGVRNIPEFKRKKTKFLSYIYIIYKYLDKETTLSQLRDFGL